MAENGVQPARQHRREANAALDAVAVKPETEQLCPRDDAVLPPRQGRNRHIHGTRLELTVTTQGACVTG